MDPQTRNKKIVDLTERELTTLGFLGLNAVQGVKNLVEQVRADPENLGNINYFQVELLRRKYALQTSAQGAPQASPRSPRSPTFPGSPVLSDSDTHFTRLSTSSSATTVVAPDLMSQYEINFYYHGLSEDPPLLDRQRGRWDRDVGSLHRLDSCPSQHHQGCSCSRHHSRYTPGPQRCPGLRCCRGVVRGDCLEAGCPPPPLTAVADNSDPTFGLSHPFNAGLGIPRASDDAQGTVALLFREVKTKDDKPSDRTPAPTNKHVATLDSTTPYDFDAANPLSILIYII